MRACSGSWRDVSSATQEIISRRHTFIREVRRAAAHPPKEVEPAEAPREAIDPVCGMSVTVAGAHHTAEVGGTKYYFCCAGCRAKFLAEPARYASGCARARGS